MAPWDGVREATTFSPSPMQRVHGDFLPWTLLWPGVAIVSRRVFAAPESPRAGACA